MLAPACSCMHLMAACQPMPANANPRPSQAAQSCVLARSACRATLMHVIAAAFTTPLQSERLPGRKPVSREFSPRAHRRARRSSQRLCPHHGGEAVGCSGRGRRRSEDASEGVGEGFGVGLCEGADRAQHDTLLEGGEDGLDGRGLEKAGALPVGDEDLAPICACWRWRGAQLRGDGHQHYVGAFDGMSAG